MKISEFKIEQVYTRPCWALYEYIEVDSFGEIRYYSRSVSSLFPHDTGLFLEDLNADDWIETLRGFERNG